MMTWCDPIEAKDLTNRDVTQSMLDDAQPIINMYSGRTPEDNPALSMMDWDVLQLKYALIYQARWMADQIDTFNRMDVSKITQDGMSFDGANDNYMILAPHARAALNRLSWRGPRSLRPRARTRSVLEAPYVSDLPRSGWNLL